MGGADEQPGGGGEDGDDAAGAGEIFGCGSGAIWMKAMLRKSCTKGRLSRILLFQDRHIGHQQEISRGKEEDQEEQVNAPPIFTFLSDRGIRLPGMLETKKSRVPVVKGLKGTH